MDSISKLLGKLVVVELVEISERVPIPTLPELLSEIYAREAPDIHFLFEIKYPGPREEEFFHHDLCLVEWRFVRSHVGVEVFFGKSVDVLRYSGVEL